MTACDLSIVAMPAAGAPLQYFGISFDALDYPSCVALASGLTPQQIPGLIDVSVGQSGLPGIDAVSAAGKTMPAPLSWAQGQCVVGSVINRVVFIVSLRPPST